MVIVITQSYLLEVSWSSLQGASSSSPIGMLIVAKSSALPVTASYDVVMQLQRAGSSYQSGITPGYKSGYHWPTERGQIRPMMSLKRSSLHKLDQPRTTGLYTI